MKTLHINLYAGPGSGKSTTAAAVFAKLKWNKIECELISEYAKQQVWQESFKTLDNQIYLFAKQHNKHVILENKVDVVITDSPLPMGCVYDNGRTKYLKEMTLNEYNKFNNLNIFLIRCKEYNPNGRMQTEVEAIEKDEEIAQFLFDNNIPYISIPGEEESIDKIVDIIKKELAKYEQCNN